jgi:hypothetical protein
MAEHKEGSGEELRNLSLRELKKVRQSITAEEALKFVHRDLDNRIKVLEGLQAASSHDVVLLW